MIKNKIILIILLGMGLSLVEYKMHQKGFYETKTETLIPNENAIKTNAITINNCAERDTFIGEVFLGKALMQALKDVYDDVSMDYRLNMYPQDKNDEIQIYLRGYFKFLPPFPDKEHINIAYMLYPLFYTHNDAKMAENRDKIQLSVLKNGNVAIDELQFYDALAVASKSYVEKLKKAGYNAYYVPQFTNSKKFFYEYDENLKSEILFVGQKRNYGAADIALAHNLPITIYGPAWGDEIAKKEYIDNDELHKYYSSAKIVLNDHREDMRTNGFINNRTYDVTITGALLITDYMPEIEEIYGDAVPMYKTEEELVSLIKYYLSHEEERQEKAQKAQTITLKYFTEKNIAAKFKQIILREKERRQQK